MVLEKTFESSLDGKEIKPVLGEGQGSVSCCSSWGCKESDTAERLNNNKSDSNLKSIEHSALENVLTSSGLIVYSVYSYATSLSSWVGNITKISPLDITQEHKQWNIKEPLGASH